MSRTLSGAEYYRRKHLIQPCLIANLHEIGAREYQEDAFAISDISDTSKGILLLLADGMGGMADGKEMSDATVGFLMERWRNTLMIDEPAAFWQEAVVDLAVEMAKKNAEKIKPGGSTLLLVHIYQDRMYYLSVGDSRICLYRDGHMKQINKEHNFEQTLKKLVEKGEITEEEAMQNKNRKSLTSFIGMEDSLKIDQNEEPILLQENDKVLLMSDGVFNTLSMQTIEDCLSMGVYEAAEEMREKVIAMAKLHQDNFTAILMQSNL